MSGLRRSLRHSRAHDQRGAAALIVTLTLLLVMGLVVAFASRGVILEQRMSTNQYRATQAFEAAEAGLEWALALLNDPRPIGTDCLPADGATQSFRERYLNFDATRASRTPRTWNNAGLAVALRPTCARHGSGWACHCPADGPASLSVEDSQPAFSVEFGAGPEAGTVRVVATGCTSLGGRCLPGADTDASGQVRVLAGLVPGIVTLPAAPLTAKGPVNVAGAPLGLHNPDALSGGLTVHAAGAIHAPLARLTTVPGGSPSISRVEGDASLGALNAQQLFASFFRIDKDAWKAQPMVTRFACEHRCGAALVAAIGDDVTRQLLWVDGDLRLDGPVVLGTPQRPVIIVANGGVQLTGAVTIHGLIYGASVAWDDAGAPSALLRGAIVSESSYQGNGAPDLLYDPAVLRVLKDNTGSFTRLPGSWRDF